MGGLQNFEQTAGADDLRSLRPRVPQRGAAGRDLRRPPARARQQRPDPQSRERRLVPNASTWSCAPPTSSGSRRTTPRSPTSWPTRSATTPSSRATSSPARSSIAFESADDLTTGRFRVRSARRRRRSPATPRNTQVRPRQGAPRGQRRPPPAPPAGPGRRPRHRRRPPDQRPRRQPPARRVPRSSATVEAGDPAAQRARPRLDQRHARRRPPDREAALHDGSTVKIGNTTMTVKVIEEDDAMSELTLFLIRFAYLAILWIFVLSAISVIRSDMFGARVPEAAPRGRRAGARQKAKQPKAPAKRRGTPDPRRSSSRAPTPASAPTSTQAPILIGRGPDAAIRLDDDYVSTRHARIAAPATSGSSRTSAPPTAPTSAPPASPSPPRSPSAPRCGSARRSSS